MEYAYLAKIYDHLMEDVDYTKWVAYIEHFIKEKSCRMDSQVLELACGTGNITIPMALKGYKITAIDRSVEMLSQAQQKAGDLNLDVNFLQQDMLNLQLQKQYNTILCLCDGINYILEPKDLKAFFQKILSLLSEDGVFIFDISTYYKLKEVLGDNTYGEDLGDVTYLWENYFSDEEETVEMDLTFFQLNRSGGYEKHKEFHVQKAYHHQDLISLLTDVGFQRVDFYHDLSLSPPKEESHRIFFVCRKPGTHR
jgi:2-polyprenyl-3-methyl-5-hydroxy-6-metoxy-1,4-benzoquinol methylase